MEIPIVIEPIAGNGYCATFLPLSLSVEGATREAALAGLKVQLQARMNAGAAIVPLQMSPAPHPLAEFAGMFKDDPDFDDVVEIMKENRRKMNEDPDIP